MEAQFHEVLRKSELLAIFVRIIGSFAENRSFLLKHVIKENVNKQQP